MYENKKKIKKKTLKAQCQWKERHPVMLQILFLVRCSLFGSFWGCECPKWFFFFGKKLQRSLVWLPELEKRLGRKIRKKTGKSSTEAHFYYYSHPWRSQKPLKNVLRICDLVSDKKYQKYFDGTTQFNDPSFLLYRFNNLKRFKPNKKKLINK